MTVLAKLKIHGRVQGVFFRQSTREKARELGLSGWVKNMPDGTVEALAAGPENVVNELIAWCEQGPAYARVEKVDGFAELFGVREFVPEVRQVHQ